MSIEINWTALTNWLRAQGLGTTIIDACPLTGGTQNRVLRLRVDDSTMVLRCPPLHPRPSSNRTMQREAAVLTTLASTGIPHPTLIATCDDLEVLGMAFYLMEEVDGFNPGEEVSDTYLADGTIRHEAGLAIARALAALGEIDAAPTSMAQYRRPGSFLSRQVDQWRSQLASYSEQSGYPAHSLPHVDTTAEWLIANRPPDAPSGIMHGDFHLNNVLLARHEPRVAAIVDWEMCTVGDPLLDLGWLLVCWPQDPAPVGTGASLACAGGLPTRRELVDTYAASSSRSVTAIDWYAAMAGFKLGIVLEQTWVRSLVGKAPHEMGTQLHGNAVTLLDLSARITRGEWSVLD